MRNLLVTKFIERLPPMVTTTFRPQGNGLGQAHGTPHPFDLGSHRRFFEQIESILSVPVAGAGVRVGSGDNYH
jgi:hypothetical protein